MASPPNTRKYPRVPIAFPVFVHAPDDNGGSFLEFGTVLNVSAGGVLLGVRKAPNARHLWLEIPVAPTVAADLPKSHRRIKATVVRKELRENLTLLGLRFDHPLVGSA